MKVSFPIAVGEGTNRSGPPWLLSPPASFAMIRTLCSIFKQLISLLGKINDFCNHFIGAKLTQFTQSTHTE